MKKTLCLILVVCMLGVCLVGCGENDVDDVEENDVDDFFEHIDDYYDSNSHTAVFEYKNISKKTITHISGVINPGTMQNEQLGNFPFTWEGNCAPGETIRIEREMILSKKPDYLGIFIQKINNGELYSAMF